jgi:uncharacterized protein YbjT (DUF2867 family)
MATQTKVLVGGATGHIGGHVMNVLHEKGYWVRALARDEKKLEGKHCDDVFVGQATKAETLKGVCDGIDVVFSSIGFHSGDKKPTLWDIDYQANINIFEEAKRAGVKHIIFISTMGGPAMATFSDIAAAREKAVNWLKASGIDYTVFRPTGYFNDLTLLFDKAATTGVIKLYGDPEGKINPLHAADFAELVAKAIEAPDWKNIEKDVGGPEILTRRELAELAFKVLGKEPNIQVKPLWQFAMIMYAMRFINFNVHHIFKFLHFTWRTPWMAATKNGHRKIGDYWEGLKKEGKIGTGSTARGL